MSDSPHQLRNKGWRAYATGNYTGAIYLFKRAENGFIKNEKWRDALQSNKGRMICESILGNLPKASECAEKGMEIISSNGKKIDKTEQSKFLHNYSLTLSRLDNYKEALKKASKAEELCKDGNFLTKIFQAKANCLMYLGKYSESIEYFDRAIEKAEDMSRLYLLEQKASCLHRLGSLKDAGKILRKAVKEREKMNILRDWTYFHLGSTLQAQGQTREAFENYEKAVRCTDSLGSKVLDDDYRRTFFAQKAKIFERAVTCSIQLKKYRRAYYYCRMAKGKIFKEEFLKSSSEGEKRGIFKKEKELRLKMRELSEKKDAGAEDYRKTEAEYGKVREKMLKDSVYGTIFRDPLSVEDIRKLLQLRQALVEFAVLKDKTVIFIITKSFFKVFTSETGEEDIASYARNITEFIKKEIPGKGGNFKWYAGKFYRKVLEKPMQAVKNYSKIIFIPHKSLHHMPFSCLPYKKESKLFEKFTISYVPSPLLLDIINKRKKKKGVSFLGVANSREDLPYAEAEVDRAKEYFTSSTVLRRSRATFNTVKNHMKKYSHIHFACHSVFMYEEPLKSHIKMHKLKKGKSRLTARDILSIDLSHVRNIILSSCSSARGKTDPGDELEGLSRAFLIAGCNSMVVTLWEIPDYHTCEFMELFYKNRKENNKIDETLSETIREFSEIHPSPRYWAGFKVVG